MKNLIYVVLVCMCFPGDAVAQSGTFSSSMDESIKATNAAYAMYASCVAWHVDKYMKGDFQPRDIVDASLGKCSQEANEHKKIARQSLLSLGIPFDMAEAKAEELSRDRIETIRASALARVLDVKTP